MDHDPSRRLARLDTLGDYRVADGAPDVRGWDVVGSDGAVIGRVMHLIVDPDAVAVRYMEVELAPGIHAEAHGTRRVLVPVGDASLDEARNLVVVRSAPSGDRGAPPAGGVAGALAAELAPEGTVRQDGSAAGNEIRVVLMREELVITKRLVAREEIVVRKRAVTEERVIEADLRRERLVVDDGRGTTPP